MLYNSQYHPGALKFDQMSVTEWIDAYVPGGVDSDFGELCISAVLDEFGGPADDNSSLNLVYLSARTTAKPMASSRSGCRPSAGPNEKWHIHGGTDLLISGLSASTGGTVNLGRKLVALRRRQRGAPSAASERRATCDVAADHVVLALPFTTLRLVDLCGAWTASRLCTWRAINEEPLGSNSKFFAQCTTRVWNAEHARATPTARCRSGRVGPHRRPGRVGRHPRCPARR